MYQINYLIKLAMHINVYTLDFFNNLYTFPPTTKKNRKLNVQFRV